MNGMMDSDEITKFINHFDAATKKPEKYLSLQNGEADEIKLFTKDLYGFTKRKEFPSKHSEALNDLVVKNLDEEQIWQQIELQNNCILNDLVSAVAHLLAKRNKLKFPIKDTKTAKEGKYNRKDFNSESEDDTNDNDQCSISEKEEISKNNKKKSVPKKHGKPSIVDDKFFKLSEMEEFLEKMEKQKGADSSDDSDYDNDVNYFDDDSELSEGDSENQPKYDDFFDEPEDEQLSRKSKRPASDCSDEAKPKKKVKFLLNNEDEDDNFSYDDDEADLFDSVNEEEEEQQQQEKDSDTSSKEGLQDGDKSKEPSTFEARQERLKTRINALEESALTEKPWQMRGEITADNRPKNSLLQEYVEFDVATRPAPVFTEKCTMRLEDIILQRIKDKAWDDVVRKIKPVDSGIEYKKTLVLDQEKSKLSLAQIYEQEYLKQVENKATQDISEKPEIEPPEHIEIKGLMKNLFSKLDALSNFHFTPKAVEPEVKIITNLPAISMEEVAPVATSDATLLAPQEVKAKHKGELIGKSERTATDKKRERRQKKIHQRLKFKKIEEKAKETLENTKSQVVQNKKFSNKLLQKITKSTNVTTLDENKGKYIRSSSAFFSKLQDESSGKFKRKNLELGKPNLSKKKSKKHK
ncbi:hypothetical protein RUM44_011167 [Polyplax serrata]|uniref:U3 small nucleolar ribonucleoprotein protein MPP10 n=1 Tax=Polyplax serrata TaxID=468196 RepID=A0ABR1AP88_POLSC